MQKIRTDPGYFYHYESPVMSHGSLQNIMGTRFDILIIDKKKPESEFLWVEIISELRRLDRMLNRFDPRSEISLINRNALDNPVHVTSEMWSILQSCLHYNRQTYGLFDVTLKDFSNVIFSGSDNSIYFSQPGTSFDLGGYAKGYALKKIRQFLLNAGIQKCFVDFGNSSILGMGHHPFGDAWRVSIENPFDAGQTADEISLRDMALSVSGNTPSYSGHIVHPKSGSPETGRKLVSVLMDDPLDAEVLSTVFLIAAESEKEQLKKSFKIFDVKEYNF